MKLITKFLAGKPVLPPILVFVLFGIIVFLSEMLSMFFVSFLEKTSFKQATVDSLFLLVFTSPAFYFLIYKPFTTHNALRAFEVEKNRILSDLSRAMLEESTITQIADLVLEKAKKLTRSEFGYVGYIDQDNGELVCTSMTGNIWEKCRVDDKTNTFHQYKGLWGWVLLNRKPLLTNSPAEDYRSQGTPEGHLPIERFLSVPAVSGDTLIGQIALANSTREYTEEDLLLLQKMADLYAVALKQKFAFDTLKTYEERYKNLFENNPQAMWIYDPETLEFIAVNDMAVARYGYSRLEFSSMTLKDMIPAEALTDSGGAFIPDRNKTGIIDHVKKDGGTLKVDIAVHKIRYLGRDCEIAFINDVTAHRIAEEEVKLFHTLINKSNDSIFVIDPADAQILYVNAKALDTLGYKYNELVGKKVGDYATNIADLADWEMLVDRIREEGSLVFEASQQRKDGSLVNVEVNATHIRYNNWNYLVSVARDISERKKAEETIIQERNKLEAVVSALGDGVTFQDRNFRILYQNRIHKQRQGDHTGELCYKAYQDRDEICDGCLLLKCFADGRVHRRETSAETEKGTIHMEVSASPVKNSKGEIIGGIETVRDITDRKVLENQLNQAHKMEAVGTRAGGIAHDFNKILSAILGYSEIAKGYLPAGSEPRDHINEVLKAGNRARDLVRQILAFSRKDADGQNIINPAPVIREGLKFMRASIPTTIDIREEITDGCGLILANTTNIHQVLVNLCTNAQHAMKDEKGTLTVTLGPIRFSNNELLLPPEVAGGEYVELMVADTGCGMDDNTRNRIFEPYYTTKRTGKGTGMGLALVHGIVQRAGGFIKVDSTPGKGTIFHVYFPAATEEPAATVEQPATQKQALPQGDERVLIIDDEGGITRMYKAALERLGYRVTAHCKSKEALEEFRAAPDNFDIVITDQTMPNITGFELAKEILRLKPEIPIILCTGYSPELSEEKAAGIGIRKYMMKPVSPQALAMSVREILDAGRP